MTVLGMVCMGTGMGLIAMPAVDAMRRSIMVRQRERTKAAAAAAAAAGAAAVRRRNGDAAAFATSSGIDEELASVMSFTISLGAFAGPMLGGLGIQYLPHHTEWGCPVAHPPPGRFNEEEARVGAGGECVSGYRWTTLVLSGLTFVVWALLYAHKRLRRKARGGRELEVPLVAIAVQKETTRVEERVVVGGDGGDGHFFSVEEHKEE